MSRARPGRGWRAAPGCLWLLLALASPVHGQGPTPDEGDDLEPARPPAAILFDVGGTLAYRDPQTAKYAWYQDSLPTARNLRELGVRVGLLSNVPRGWDLAMLARLLADPEPLGTLFDPVVLAQSPPPPGRPPAKPDPRAFQAALDRLGPGVEPADVVYVGENHAEVLGARLAGLRAVLLVRRGNPPAGEDHVIRRLPQLIQVLPGLE
jgi:FMN phosphatase YigB (HAD superfamily)